MRETSEGGEANEGYTRPRLAHLENILQELSRHEEHTTFQSVERTSMNTKQRLLNGQLLQTKKNDEQEEGHRAQSERALEQLQAQVTQLKGEFSTLKDKYQALEHERDMLLADNKMSAKDIEAKETQVDELMQLLDLERSKQPIAAAEPKEIPAGDQDNSELQGRVKMLEVRC
ncbi:hypothetical protein BBO99_00006964 [Phytophthora kernoviae]|uniref:Uncharacterized protein n=2 Tax=Phytophthora kernoviae TaxID=325452 RepID=A0A3R7HFV6_9STRA|nr:hypothetical protein G195_007821 [Phytophthora kernoviae 00238/432]KAG2520803.1 hypothetical protein JM16_006574 [Phytophthora kernoviae]KAG2521733.1 hypothetical protein JM18_006383 [Phytophthora kernoviae]RLN26320.1 hypothetical protein BBI17_006967 [Phytophthora kernoviae]RLN77180.1 hypothetical protein BBO99_00006964 [Phytophthora kernoviae]